VPRSVRLQHVATWVALAGSLGLAVLFVWGRATAPSDGARISFYGDGWSSAGVRIAPIDAPAAGLQDGDLVVAVDDRPMDDWLADAADRSVDRPTAGTPIPYGVVRDGTPLSVAVTWAAPAVGATLLEGWSVILFSLSAAALAAFVFARRPGERAATALMLAACGAAGSSVPWFLGTTVSDIVQGTPFLLYALVTGPLYMVLWPAGLHLALVFPAPLPVATRHRWLVPGAYAIALGGYALAMLVGRVATATDLEWVGTWPTAQVAVVVPILALSLALFVRSYRRTTDLAARTRIRWAWLGVVASATIGLACFMVPELLLHHPLLPESWIGLVALPLPLGLAAGILRNRLFDIDVVVRRTFVYGGLTLGVVASYVAVTSAITALVGGDHGFGASLFATGVAALVALPLRDGLQRAVNRLLYGERDEPWRAMRRLGQRLDLAADPDRVFPVIVETVADALRSPYVGLEVLDEIGRPATVAERGARLEAVVSVPLVHGADRVGTLTLGVRHGERGFRPDETDLLGGLARQAGGAIHALRLQADLARSHERLLVAREEERRRLRHDLHDGLGPSLAAIGLRAEASAEVLTSDPEVAKRLLDELGADVRATLDDIRRLVDGLRPPALDELGLLGAIEQQAARLEGSTGAGPVTTIAVEGRPLPLPALPAAVEVAAYRIAVEALTNAVRHAEARTCAIRLDVGDELVVEVVDDGNGLPSGVAPGTGLESMESRAAELGGSVRIERRRGGGTRLEARLPIAGLRLAVDAPSAVSTEPAHP
jgi:signal transduction histidine kinase